MKKRGYEMDRHASRMSNGENSTSSIQSDELDRGTLSFTPERKKS